MYRLAVCLFLATLPAAAQDVRPADAARLDQLQALFGPAQARALVISDRPEQAVLLSALKGKAAPVAPEGEWRCRMIKLGGPALLAAYRDFECLIDADGPGRWRFEKTGGSQRMRGEIVLQSNGNALYRGVGFVTGGPATDYEGLPPSDQTPVEPGQTHAQVGAFEQMGPDRARLLLPAPILESAFDILYLTR